MSIYEMLTVNLLYLNLTYLGEYIYEKAIFNVTHTDGQDGRKDREGEDGGDFVILVGE